MSPVEAKTRGTLVLPLCSDAVVTRPTTECDQQVVAVALYQLDEARNVRQGGIQVFQVNGDDGFEFEERYRDVTLSGGMLDLSWLSNGLILLGAGANGRISVWNFSPDKLESPDKTEIRGGQGNCLLLSLDVSVDEREVVTSNSHGGIAVIEIETERCLWEHGTAHDHEAWCVAFRRRDSSVIYSGGDDCVLKCHDRRVPLDACVVGKTSRSCFEAGGVTALSVLDDPEDLLLSGSYDGRLRYHDCRMLSSGPVSEVSLGGGVWRIKWKPTSKARQRGSDVAVAGMYEGCYVVDTGTDEVVARYTGHEGLMYGLDWLDNSTLVSSSFYSKQLHSWSVLGTGGNE